MFFSRSDSSTTLGDPIFFLFFYFRLELLEVPLWRDRGTFIVNKNPFVRLSVSVTLGLPSTVSIVLIEQKASNVAYICISMEIVGLDKS